MLVFPLLNIQKILCTLTYKDEGLYFSPPQTCEMFPSGAEAAFVQWMNVFFFHLSLCIINYLHKQNAVCYCCVGNMNLKCRAVGGNDDFFFSPTKQRARMYGMFIIYIGDITRRGKKHLSKVFYTSMFMKQGCVTVR